MGEANINNVNIVYQPLQATNLKTLESPVDLELYARISICHVTSDQPLKYEWKIIPENHLPYESTSFNCSFIFQTTRYSSIRIKVSLRTRNNTLVARGETTVELNKTWVAVIGDSFAAGEGAPEKKKDTIEWLNERCHRSRNSFAYQVTKNLAKKSPNTTFQLSFLSCSGVRSLDLFENFNAQLPTLERIAKARKSGPDMVFLTIGANDIGFTEILQALSNRHRSLEYFESRFLELSFELDRIASRLNQMGTARVILPLYYDITRNENGEVDASCGAFGKIKNLRLAQAEKKILRKLNDLLLRKGERYGWTVVDSIPSIFSTRGVCSSKRLVLTPEDSFRIEQSVRGAFHPSEEGHRMIAEEVLRKIR